jgi:hypothetical protein
VIHRAGCQHCGQQHIWALVCGPTACPHTPAEPPPVPRAQRGEAKAVGRAVRGFLPAPVLREANCTKSSIPLGAQDMCGTVEE